MLTPQLVCLMVPGRIQNHFLVQMDGFSLLFTQAALYSSYSNFYLGTDRVQSAVSRLN